MSGFFLSLCTIRGGLQLEDVQESCYLLTTSVFPGEGFGLLPVFSWFSTPYAEGLSTTEKTDRP
jgi:hypothetical protein